MTFEIFAECRLVLETEHSRNLLYGHVGGLQIPFRIAHYIVVNPPTCRMSAGLHDHSAQIFGRETHFQCIEAHMVLLGVIVLHQTVESDGDGISLMCR